MGTTKVLAAHEYEDGHELEDAGQRRDRGPLRARDRYSEESGALSRYILERCLLNSP